MFQLCQEMGKAFALSLFSICIPGGYLQAQISYNQAKALSSAAEKISYVYFHTLKGNAQLFNGSEYLMSNLKTEGHPFFGSNTLMSGSLEFGGVIYYDLPLLYDLVSDEIIIEDFTRTHYIRLPKEKIARFTIPGHEFVRITQDSTTEFASDQGFYEVIYTGPVSVFLQTKKYMRYRTDAEKVNYRYISRTTYFLLKDHELIKITNLSSLLSAFGNKKADLKKFYRSRHLDFKKDTQKTIVSIVRQNEEKN